MLVGANAMAQTERTEKYEHFRAKDDFIFYYIFRCYYTMIIITESGYF